MKPRYPILDSRFRYTPSSHSDIRLTFAKERKRLLEAIEIERALKVRTLKRKEA